MTLELRSIPRPLGTGHPEAYVVVKTRGKRAGTRLPLPVTIGSSPMADVIVAAEAVLPLAAVATLREGRLQVYDARLKQFVSDKTLARYGIRLIGPVHGNVPERPSMATRLKETLAAEAQWFAGLPEKRRRLLGGKLPQGGRFALWAGAAAMAVALLGGLVRAPEMRVADLSRVPLELVAGKVRMETLGASATRFGYERGVTFHLSGVDRSETQLLSFEVGGLDEDREIVVHVNGREVMATKAEPQCIEAFCAKSVAIEPGHLKEGTQEIHFAHEGGGVYLIKKLHVAPLPELTEAEQISLDRWYRAAERAFADRHITADNILAANELLSRAQSLLKTRRGGGEIRHQVEVLTQDPSGRGRDQASGRSLDPSRQRRVCRCYGAPLVHRAQGVEARSPRRGQEGAEQSARTL